MTEDKILRTGAKKKKEKKEYLVSLHKNMDKFGSYYSQK